MRLGGEDFREQGPGSEKSDGKELRGSEGVVMRGVARNNAISAAE